ncbi:MAG: MFS transporter [Simkaniaceae bacterium]|nr:MFS transporter [Simkaniaceae bacterium]
MSFVERLLRADPPHPTVTDKKEIARRYFYWRIRVFYSMYIGYALFYFTRKSFAFSMPLLSSELGFSASQLGFLGSLLSFSYGFSKLVGGVLSDRINLRYFMGAGLFMTGLCNIFFGLSSSLLFFGIFMTCNGFFQGWGSPPCARLLTCWYSQKERGRWWGVWNTSHNLGGAIIPLICVGLGKAFGWQYGMHAAGLLAMIFGLFLINRLRDTPRTVGLPPIEEHKKEVASEEVRSGSDRKSAITKETPNALFKKYVLKNKFIWILGIAYFFVYIVRTAINDWTLMYLIRVKDFSMLSAGMCIFWFEIGGLFGSLSAGWMSDTLFRGKRGPVNALFTLGVVGVLFALWIASTPSVPLFSLIIFTIGFLIFGPQMLIGMAAAELAGKRVSGAATGFVGFFAYAGATVAGYPVGRMIDLYGWSKGLFVPLALSGLVAVAFLFPLWNRKPGRAARMS